jgi:sulfotransferase
MKQTLFYQSSLPRAGSTLLQNIMGQNPDFHVTPTSGMIDLMLGTRIGYNGNKEAKAGDTQMWKEGFYSYCREGFKGYISNLTDKPYILDKNRAWGSYYPLLNKINPNPKIIFMVRDLKAIFASMEKKFRMNPDYDDGLLDNAKLKNITTQQRIETWSAGHPIGYALEKLNQSILDKSAQNFLFIKYEDLCSSPQIQIDSIYNYLDIPSFIHNFDSIPQVTTEDDTVYGIYGDHIIRNTLSPLPDDTIEILGKSTCDWINKRYKAYSDIMGYRI